MSERFKKWLSEKAKEATLHRALGMVEGYQQAIKDVRAELFGKTITLDEADTILARMARTARELKKETLTRKR